ncbi:MAG: hypothetical protein AB7G75_23055, partial [Candidatus Binatia bacterium]
GVAFQSSSLMPSGGEMFAMLGSLPITNPQPPQPLAPPLCGYEIGGPFSLAAGGVPEKMLTDLYSSAHGRSKKTIMQRKLTAILSADVQGYSRLMGDDEEATIRTLTAYREVIRHRSSSIVAGWSMRPAIICWPSSPVLSMPCRARWRFSTN